MYNLALPYFLTISTTCQIKYLSYIFSYFKKVSSHSFTKQIYKLWPFKQSNLATVFFKSIEYVYETFQNVAPILHPSIPNKRQGVAISSCFLWKLSLFIVKRFYNVLYSPICGLLCLLSYWE